MTARILPIPGIYCITCYANGARYIGSSKKVSHRWNKHRRELMLGIHQNSILQRTWDKYGPDSFAFELIEPVADPQALVAREQHWLDTSAPEMNLLATAYSCIGRQATEAQKSAARAAQLGKPKAASTRQKISETLTGRPTSEAARLARLNSPLVKAHMDRIHAAKLGVPRPPEAMRKLAITFHRKRLAALASGRTPGIRYYPSGNGGRWTVVVQNRFLGSRDNLIDAAALYVNAIYKILANALADVV